MLNTKRSLFMALLTVAGSECAKIATGIMAAMLLLCSCNHNIYMFDGYNNNGSRLAQQDAMLHQLRKDANLCVDKTHHYILTNDSIEALYCIGQYKQKADSISLISKQRFNNTSVLFKYNMYQIILVTMFLVSLFGVIFYHSFKKKQLASLTIQRLRERLLHNKYLQSEAHVAQKAEHIKMLEKELSEKTEQNSSLEKELEETKKYIVDFQHVTDTANALKYADEQLLSNSHVCQAIRHVLNDRTSDTRNLKEEEWGQLDKEVHVFYPEFKSSLVRLCKISEIEYRLCLLLKINIGLADIATLLNRSKEAVYSSRRRLYKKAFQTDGGADQWDAFVRSL